MPFFKGWRRKNKNNFEKISLLLQGMVSTSVGTCEIYEMWIYHAVPPPFTDMLKILLLLKGIVSLSVGTCEIYRRRSIKMIHVQKNQKSRFSQYRKYS